ncbi:MAG: lipid-A-disaccharide synthase [Hyphomicrobium sp.]
MTAREPLRSSDTTSAQPLRVFIVAGEHSGDALGGKLMTALQLRHAPGVTFAGVGGHDMQAAGLASLFAIEDVAVMGPLNILPALPRIVRRVYQTVDAALAFAPDVLVIIDSPEFTHPIAKRVRKRAPQIPIINYVSPSVWAWRSGRARKMRGYVDEILALLPFEPDAHARLGGPRCTYVGHPLIEQLDAMRAADADALAARLGIAPTKKVLLVLPGSRRSEVDRLIGIFGGAVNLLGAQRDDIEVIVPALPHVHARISDAAKGWRVKTHLIGRADDKYAAFKLASAAIAASGTVTLELALAGTPMVIGYTVDPLMGIVLRRLLKTDVAGLANHVLGEKAFPELMQEACTADLIARTVAPLFEDSPERRAQLAALNAIAPRMDLHGGTPSAAAAETVLACVTRQAAGKSRRPGPT